MPSLKRICSVLIIIFGSIDYSESFITSDSRVTSTGPAFSSVDPSPLNPDPNEIIARRIIVNGAVQGGYYRACVKNEASRFRKLVGNMTPPDDSNEAEIYVEGKRRQVESFLRWCRKGDVGLSQVVAVKDVITEDPLGLYDDFYIQTR